MMSAQRGLAQSLLTRVHAFDELFFGFDRGRIVRNKVALGVSAAIGTRGRVERYHVWSDERARRTGASTSCPLALASVLVGR